MPLNHLSTSEIVTGLLLSGKQTLTAYNPDKFSGQYAKVVSALKGGKSLEELITMFGAPLIQTSQYAAKSVNGLGTDADWASILDQSYRDEVVLQELDKAKKFLSNGETDKAGDILRRATATLNNSQRLRSVTADEISDEYVPLMKSGSRVWDEEIGGFPTVGTTIIGAKTYTGKTTLAILAMNNYLLEYPDREIMFVTLEDMNNGYGVCKGCK